MIFRVHYEYNRKFHVHQKRKSLLDSVFSTSTFSHTEIRIAVNAFGCQLLPMDDTFEMEKLSGGETMFHSDAGV